MIIEKEIFGQKLSYEIGNIHKDPDLHRVGYDSPLQQVNIESCYTQGELYEFVARKEYDMHIFSDVYLNSDFCNRLFDDSYCVYHHTYCGYIWDFIKNEIHDKLIISNSKEIFYPSKAWWIGLVYRILHIETNLSSKILVQKVPFEFLDSIYNGYEEENFTNITDLICEFKDIKRYKVEI